MQTPQADDVTLTHANENLNIFVSYNNLDRERVQKVVDQLRMRPGIEVAWDQDFPVGDLWRESIKTAIIASDVIVFLVSRVSNRADWVITEHGIAKGAGRPTLVLIIDDNVPKDQGLLHVVAEEQCVDASKMRTAGDLADKVLTTYGFPITGRNVKPLVISVYGSKGGTGKSTFSLAMAEIFAARGLTVTMVDMDLPFMGLTEYVGVASDTMSPDVLTTQSALANLDTILLKTGIDVTPEYLLREGGRAVQQSGKGSIILVPARSGDDVMDPQKLLTEARGWPLPALEGRYLRSAVVIYDLPGSDSTAVSACVMASDITYCVCHPRQGFLAQFAHTKKVWEERHHRKVGLVQVVVNNVRDADLVSKYWKMPTWVYLPHDPELTSNSANSNFKANGLGYGVFLAAVLQVMGQTTPEARRWMIPDSINSWIAPVIVGAAAKAPRILKRWEYRFHSWLLLALILFGAGIVLELKSIVRLGTPASARLAPVSAAIRVPAGTDPAIVRARVSAIRVPAELGTAVRFSGSSVTVTRPLRADEVEKMLQAIPFEDVKTCFIEVYVQMDYRSQTATQSTSDQIKLFGSSMILECPAFLVGFLFLRGQSRKKAILIELARHSWEENGMSLDDWIVLRRLDSDTGTYKWLRGELLANDEER